MADANSILYIVLIGLAAGVLASLVVPTGLDLLGAIVVGIIGAAIGFYLFPALGGHVTGNPTVASIITATVGAILLLVVLRFVRR
ncbi:GlsB/YeaQ/YmgE family stress response membrane protein [Rhodomicrobium vannielii ATCC 17100]|uniref:GlsB/YeaQ/YmgE family stress response membrane protein n=1 Tax=Rhodomicrobium udaipurense TaxID=1202716 RepID=A0A8I1GFA7_9HYPH|nr:MULTISPECIES: GlsB/YeaQ/YmgE family stress response membrane protein [Rhodomicrobium]KAI94109.1 membrane protein [Rhodomicrobium udaipurense JA643]MBJ7534767.1 GlsB/YeaQ/YmgE family stress response membrane protein [Rhodomicrobium vannielii ATCC 17100]MBJ7542676.1 GlsB/YeaQ/YmgE family stress response membrane protein [Rhodomicrobium udaipurense]